MKNNFDLKDYMKSNKVGSYQQLNEMWYQDINQALGDFNEAKVIDSINEEEAVEEQDMEMEEAKSTDSIEEIKFDDAIVPIKQTMQSLGYKGEYDPFVEEGYIFEKDFADGVMRISITALNADEEKFTFTAVHFDKITKSQLFGLIKKHVIDYENGNWVSKDGDVEIVDLGTGMFSLDKPGVQDLIKKTVQRVEDKAVATKGIDEMAGDNVKSLGAGKMAHANTRVNLGRHRSSDTLDKQVAKDHDKNTIKGAKAAAYKPPYMKEEETADDIFAGSDAANWKNNYGNETSDWDTEIAGQTVKGWTAEETQGGAIAWQNPRYPNAHIYATPGWEGVDGIAFELHDSEDGYMDEPKIQKVVGAGTEAWKTKEGYMALMAKAFTVVEKMLTPSDNMDEDHGTQIDHDKNDNISKDHSEFEDTVNEDVDPFGSIKTGIDKITQDDDDDMDMSDDDRFNQLGGDKIKAGIEGLMGDGFDFREILQFVKDTIASKRNY